MKVSRQLVESAEDMKRLALGALRSIQNLQELVKSSFRQPECRYILEWHYLLKNYPFTAHRPAKPAQMPLSNLSLT